MKKRVVIIILSLFLSPLLSPLSLAGNDKNASAEGSSPNGKPFVHLQSQIDALQVEMESLIGEANSMGERLSNAESALFDLMDDVDANEALIVMLNTEIGNLTTAIAEKQDVINAYCGPDEAVTAINGGSITCETLSSGGGALARITSLGSFAGTTYYTQQQAYYLLCPAGYTSVSGGFDIRTPQTASLISSHSFSNSEGWSWKFELTQTPGGAPGFYSALYILNCITL